MFLVKVNPNSDWCWDGHLAKMAAIAGMSYKEMRDAILKTAEACMHRHNDEGVGHKQSP
jgi:D-alanine-D-alanine ligase